MGFSPPSDPVYSDSHNRMQKDTIPLHLLYIKHFEGEQIEEAVMGGERSMHERDEICIQNCTCKSVYKIPLRYVRRDGNTITNLKVMR
jgi:hypothetical protein